MYLGRTVVHRFAVFAVLAAGAVVLSAQTKPDPSQKQEEAQPKAAVQVTEKVGVVSKPAVEEPKKKGAGEGIQVHGHWTIEVRDPDGKVETHREFENMLWPFGANGSTGGGAATLTSLLTGQISTSLNLWLVDLGDTGFRTEVKIGGTGLLPNTCNTLAPPNPPTNCALSLINSTVSTGGFVLTGSVPSISVSNTSPAPVSLTQVSTSFYGCLPLYAPCLANTAGTIPIPFTYATLPPPGIAVSTGQTVMVTVQISFQ